MWSPCTLVVAQVKGGVGKSTTAWAVSSQLAKNMRVLLVDLDPQGTLTIAVTDTVAVTAYDVLARAAHISKATTTALPAYGPNLSIVSSHPALAGLDAETAGRLDRQYLVADAFATVHGFDFVIVDTPAGQSILSSGALAAADFCLTPSTCDDAAFQQLATFQKTVELVRRRINPRLVWLPLIASAYDQRQVMDRAVVAAMRETYPVFDQAIPKRVSIREEMAMRHPCTLPEFNTLTQEILRYVQEEVRAPPPGRR